MQFNDQNIWITGASSGIGEALARALAPRGARLILSARRTDELKRVQQACGLGADRCLILPLDVADHASLGQKAQEALAWAGSIDILINNAGISQRSRVLATSLDVEKKLMDVNYFGVIELTRSVLPAMVEQQSGQIVVISSVMGKIGTPVRSSYAASKHALHGYFDCLRSEVYEDGIRITMICPGYVRTNISKNALNPDGSPHGKMDVYLDRGMDPDLFARKALRAIASRKAEVIIGGFETFGVTLRKFAPGLLERIVRNRVEG